MQHPPTTTRLRFLDFLAADLSENPERVQPLESDLVMRIETLVGNVEVDLDTPLADDRE